MSANVNDSLRAALSTLDDVFADKALLSKHAIPDPHLEISTPALLALMEPSAKRRRMGLLTSVRVDALQHPNAVSTKAASTYKPHSLDDLFKRISTYSLALWNDNKPSGCDAATFARHGWHCDKASREAVRCVSCDAFWQLSRPKHWLSPETDAEAASVRDRITTEHASPCPWKYKPCSETLYSLPLCLPRQQQLSALLKRVIALHSVMPGIKVQSLPIFDLVPVQHVLLTVADAISAKAVTDATVAAALLGWEMTQTPLAQSTSADVTSDSQSRFSAKPILRCQYCLRSITLSRISTSDGSTAVHTIDVIKSHRRFCAYLQPLSAEGKSPWQTCADGLIEPRRTLAEVQISPDAATSKIYNATLHPLYFGMIASGEKLWEGRCFRGQWMEVEVGDFLHFTQADDKTKTITRRVLDVRRYADFRDMLETDEMLQGCLPGITTVEEGLDIYHGFPGYLEASLQYGAVALKLGDPNVDPANPSGDAAERDYLKRRARAQLLKEETRSAMQVVSRLLAGGQVGKQKVSF